ncbi:hypothetical protein V5O48_015119 [Marasmius crinis-equi]|uniref:Uncharacterized protein n=1 Tax=Marasmius crinis-equi TaxID=585013 RepID=A0ABR3EVF6_9AGAR
MGEVAKHTNQQEISHCAGFKAIAHANTKKSKGLRATGIGAVSCAQHGTFRPNGMGDLQFGERYSNMDFIGLFSIIGLHMLSLFFFSYDIVCQWAVNFWTRMAEFPEAMHIPSTARASLMKKLVKAVLEAVVNAQAYTAFTDVLKDEHSDELRTWQEQVIKWEQGDPDVKCPYEVSDKVITLNRVKKEVAEEEYRREQAGENNAFTSLSAVIIEGVEIEESHRRSLFAAAESKKRTDLQERSINTRRTNLLQRIWRFRESQLVLMPGLRRLIEAEPGSECTRPETMKLFLPSSLDLHSRTVVCLPEVLELEAWLRYAQAHESLGQLRSQLRARSVAYRHTSRLALSQGTFTKMNHLQHKLETRIKAVTATYRGARATLLELRGEGDWTSELRDLKDEDIRGISERVLAQAEKEDYRVAQERAGVSEDTINDVLEDHNIPTVSFNPLLALGQSMHTLSWIWYTHSVVIGTAQSNGGSFDELQDSLRSEWCKTRANARRSHEEVRLVDEEMRRAIEYCYYLSRWWEQQIGRRTDLPVFLEEGLTAYAREHAHVERECGLAWSSTWSQVRIHSRKVLEYLLSTKHGELPEDIPELEVELDIDDDEKGDEEEDEEEDD